MMQKSRKKTMFCPTNKKIHNFASKEPPVLVDLQFASLEYQHL